MNDRLAGHEPGNDVALISRPHPTTSGSDAADKFFGSLWGEDGHQSCIRGTFFIEQGKAFGIFQRWTVYYLARPWNQVCAPDFPLE
jgi:hypothetical protein